MLAVELSSFPPQAYLFGVTLALIALLLPWLRQRDLVCLLLGGSCFWLHAVWVVDSRLAADFAGDSMLATVRIVDFPKTGDRTTSFVATARGDERLPQRMQLSWFEPPVSLRLGDVWRLELRLRRPRGAVNPGSRDFEAWLFRERIGASGYVAGGRHNRLLDSQTTRGIDRIREHYLERLERRLPGQPSASVLAAIVVGARHRMTADQWERYARTGTSHLMAISGLHVGLAAAGFYLIAAALVGCAGYRGNQHHAALVAAMLFAVAYATVSGFAVPARRAALMLVFATACLLARRQVGAPRILAAAALLIVLADPLSTMAPGFKLSFAAVALLFWLALRRRAAIVRPLLKPAFAVRDLATVQTAMLTGLLPLTVLIFDRLSLAAPLVNLVAVPWFSIVTVPLALLSLLLDGPFRPAGDVALSAAAASVEGIEALIAAAARKPDSAFAIAEVRGIAWLYLTLPLAWVLLPPRWPGRAVAWLALAALPLWRPAAPPEGCADMTMLDVGQGLAVVVRTRERTLLYDTGPSYRSGGSAAERIVLPFLAGEGIDVLDRIVISHADLDHAGGTRALLESVEVGDVLSGEPLAGLTSRSSACRSDMAWEWNGVRFSILHPDFDAGDTGNDASCILLIEAGDYRALLTGDIESGVEARLVRQRVLPKVNVVSVPHHGSRTSSIAPFVESLQADFALVSAAAGNQWGFPKPDVVARWERSGARVVNTASSGAIAVRICRENGPGALVEHRKRNHRIWHDADS